MSNITMKYGVYEFIPRPLMTLKKEFNRQGDRTIVGATYTAEFNGTLETVTASGGASLSGIIDAQTELRTALDEDGLRFEIACDSGVLFACYPNVTQPVFDTSDNNWVQTCPYTFGLTFHDIPYSGALGSGENNVFSGSAGYVTNVDESWDIEVDEESGYFLTEITGTGTFYDNRVYNLRLSHSVNAVGQQIYDSSGIVKEAWQQAHAYVVHKLGYDYGFQNLAQSGVLNFQSSFGWWQKNHIRSIAIDEAGGSCAATESWILVDITNNDTASGNSLINREATEDFTVEVRESAQNNITTVSINGNIQGYESRDYGEPTGQLGDFAVTVSKWTNASSYWNNLTDGYAVGNNRLWARANNIYTGLSHISGTNALNNIPLTKTIGSNQRQGVITYSIEYDNRPYNCIAGAIFESVRINYTNPSDVFAELAVPGRSAGPVLQDIGTITSSKLDVSVDATVAVTGACTAALMLSSKPTGANGLIDGFYLYLSGIYSQVFTHVDSESWEPRNGRYSRQIGWTYQSGC